MSACSVCGEDVLEGALRCRHCGVPFEGPSKQPRLKPYAKVGAGLRRTEDGVEVQGFGISFGFEPDDTD